MLNQVYLNSGHHPLTTCLDRVFCFVLFCFFFQVVFYMGCFHFGFRYEVFWLPLIAEFPDATVAAPLDIAWVWHVHMLSPLAYERDCSEIVSTLMDHKILVGEEREAGLQKAKLLWHQMYGNEPYEVDLSAPASIVPHVSRIQYDIVAGCSRQRVFYYQVSLPHYGCLVQILF